MAIRAAQARDLLTLKSTSEGEWQRLSFAGPFNEHVKELLSPLPGNTPAKCIIDLGGVASMNSCGVRDFAQFLRTFKTGRDLVFEAVPAHFIMNMNMVRSLRAGIPVRSLYRDFACERCGHEEVLLLTAGVEFGALQQPSAGPPACSKCGGETLVCESDEVFFSFLTEV